ncbi:MAG: Hsp33 family molecular chaperone HslO [Bdellovibrionales bacterium]|nr:Hsp33 family molecular chaperone HslO [Bdellovibrionales bacterium]
MDILKKVIIDNGSVQLVVVNATQLVQQSMVQSEAWPPATIHLGQGLLAALALLSIFTKDTTGKISLQWSSHGPFGDLYVEADPQGNVRGTILKPQAPVQNLYASMGAGNLMVRKTFQNSSTGIVSSKGDVCNDVLNYLDQSEQRRCAMNLWVDLSWDDKNKNSPVIVRRALGYLLESLPDSDLRKQTLKSQIWEDRLSELGTLSKWNISQKNPLEDMIQTISSGSPYKEVMSQNIRFHCNCSEERAERALALAVRESGEPQIEDESIRCEFCGKVYNISPQNH